MIFLLDTTFLVDLMRHRKRRRSLLADMVLAGHSFSISAVTVAELYGGMRLGEEFATANLLSNFFVEPVLVRTARRAGELKASWARQGRTLGIADMIIAATALELDLTLLTDNRKDFPMPELRLFDLPPA